MARRKSYDFTSRSGSYTFARSGGLAPLDLSPSPLTLSQELQIEAARKHGHSESFWDRIKSGGGHVLHPIEWTFDKILRPAYGIAAGLEAEAKSANRGGSFLHNIEQFPGGFVRGFTGKEKHGIGQVLETKGVLEGHRRLRGLAGFGLDVISDPVTYLSGGSTILAKSGEHAAAIAAGRRALDDAAGRAISHGKVSIDEALTRSSKDLEHLTTAGKDYRYRRALTEFNVQELNAAKVGEQVDDVFRAKKHVIASAAQAEEKRVEKFVPHYALAGMKLTPSIAGRAEKIGSRAFAQGRQLVPSLPKIDNIIAREGIGSTTARRFRETFIRASTETPETHAMAISTKHISERITHEQFRMATRALAGAAEGISGKRQREVLHFFEKPLKGHKAIIKKGEIHIVNPRYVEALVKSGKITAHEGEFVTNYQNVVEHLFHNEKAFGAVTKHFSEGTGRMYVPHLMDRAGNPLNDEMRKLTTKAGFERARSDREFSLKQLVDFAERGDLPRGVVKDPYELLVSRIRASARRQAELGQLDAMSTIGGVRTRLVNTKALDKVRGKIDDRTLEFLIRGHEHTRAATQAIKDHEEAIANAESRVRSIKFGKKTRTKAANLRRAEDKLAKLRQRGPFLGDAQERFSELQGLDTELKSLAKEENKILKGKANPAHHVDMHTVADLKDEFGHPIALPDELGQAAQKVRRVIDGDDAAIRGFEGAYRKMLSRWKVIVTSINPGYRMRNSQTDIWNWWLQPGVNTVAMAKNLTKATRFLVRMKNIEREVAKNGLTPKTAKAIRDFQDMYDNGILSGLFQGDVQTAAEMLRLGRSKAALLKKARLIKFGEKAAQDMNRNGENWVRIAHYFWAKEDKKLSAVEASLSVKAAHFDYEDLTPFEQRRLKAIAPFYTWTRKNIPYQIRAIFESPGKYAAFPKGVMEAEYVAGDNKGDIIPDYISNAWGVPLGGGNYVLPQMGVSDLQAIDSPSGPKDRLLSLLTPAAKLPIELATNKNLFTGGPIASDTHPLNPTTPLGSGLIGLLHAAHVPYTDVGETSRIGPGGTRLYGPGANPYLLHVLGYLGPTANLLLKKTGGIGAAQTPVSPFWSYGAGISVQHVDQAQQQLLEQIVNDNTAKKMMTRMRDEGLIPQAKPPRSKKSQRIGQIIAQERGRR